MKAVTLLLAAAAFGAQANHEGNESHSHGAHEHLAGGLHERASTRKMFVIRAGDSAQAMERVDYATIVLPGDVITIEESFF